MPNWTTNTIYADKEVIDFIINENGEVDFNTILPMPNSLNIEEGSHKDDAITYFVTERLTKTSEASKLNDFISNHFSNDWGAEMFKVVSEKVNNLTQEELDSLYEDGKMYVDNLTNYGHYTWYGWCRDVWGTKWNACDTYRENDNTVLFSTAWCLPEGFYKALCSKFKDNTIVMYAEDEDTMEYICKNDGGEFDIVEEAESEYVEDKFEEDGEEYTDCYREYVLQDKFFDNLPYVK